MFFFFFLKKGWANDWHSPGFRNLREEKVDLEWSQAWGCLFPYSGCRLGLPGATVPLDYHLRPKSASSNYLLSRELESFLSAEKQLIIAPTSRPWCASRSQDCTGWLSVDFGVSSGILYIFKFSLGTSFLFSSQQGELSDIECSAFCQRRLE